VSGRRGGLAPLDTLTTTHYYTRVSGDKQADEGLSLAQQPERCREYIGRLPRAIVGEHFEDIESGRDDYQRMLLTIRGLAASGTPQALVVPAFDRLGRNVAERVRAYEELKRIGVPIHSVRDGGVVPEFVYNILAAVAQEESRQLGVRLREINDGLAEQGWHKPGSVAWGYARRPATDAERGQGSPKTVLVIDDAAAPYVREAWERLAAGESVRSIAGWIARLPDAVRGGRNLGFNAVRKLFRAPVYVGRLGEYDDDDPAAVLDRPAGREPALIEDGVWMLAVGSKRMAARMPRQASGEYLLTGLLRCYRCGSRMSGRRKGTQGGTRAPRREYICHAGMTLGAANQARCLATIKAEVLEDRVIRTVGEILAAMSRPRGRERIESAVERQRRVEAAGDGRKLLPGLVAERVKVQDRIVGASTLLIDGVMDRDAYGLVRAQYGAELAALDAEIARVRGASRGGEALSLETVLRGMADWSAAFAHGAPGAVRDVLGLLLESVEPVRLGRGSYEVRPVWTAMGRLAFWAAAELGDSENLVSIDNFGRTKLSTPTLAAPLAAAG
jgi:DNA invertase Pin-like site-specific DNA recombinase